MQDAVRRHDAILRVAIAEHGGHIFKTMGDAFCSAFTRPQDAIDAMLVAQRRLSAEDFSAVDGLRVRVALHTGSADERNNDYFGPAVNRVARLLALGHGGQILLSSAVAQLVSAHLPPQTVLRNLGVYHLKGVADPEQVHQLAAPGLATEFPPLRPAAAPDDLAIRDADALHPVPGFSGREDELAALSAALTTDGSVAVVHGLGGVGKSSLAREFAWRNREQHAVVWWLNADTEDGIIEGLLRLGVRFIPGLDEMKDRRVAAQRVIGTALGGFAKPVLLVFDNLEEEALLRTWRPHSGARLLLTSRSSTWSSEIVAIALQTWELDTAVGYLQRESRRTDLSEVDARAIAEALGALPLALAHAAASLRSMRMMTPQRYLQHINDHLRNAPRGAEYPRSVFATFSTAIAQAEKEAPHAPAVLRFAASFSPDAIPEELFAQPIELYPEDVQPALADELGLDAALGTLDRLSLLAFSDNSRTYSLHRLVQIAARESRSDDANIWREGAVGVADAAFPAPEFDRWPQCERLLPHARAAIDALSSDTHFPPAGRLAHHCGFFLWRRGEYPAAELLLARALAIREKAIGPEHADVAESITGLAIVYMEQGRYTKGELLFRRALAIREKAFGPEHPEFARSLSHVAIALSEQRRFAEAEPLHKRALAIQENALGPDDLRVAHCLANLAEMCREQGRYDEAEPLFERNLATHEKVLGPEHPEFAYGLNNLAKMYGEQGRYDEAESLHNRVLAIREKTLGPEHHYVAHSVHNLANVYAQQERYDEAEPLFKRALATFEKAVGPEHVDVVAVLTDLARLYEAQGQRGDAEPLYVQALAIREKTLGADHPETKALREKLEKPRSS
jgi:tetratricopeptide (TPR) repeat protein